MFSDIAPAYWAAGIPVIPLRPKSKIPAPNRWQSYAAEMPDEDTRAQWLLGYPDGNIGLPLGPQSGMLAIDLDSEDPKVLKVLKSIMPNSPWKRVGRKGAVYMFKYNGERTTRIKHDDGSMVIEILARGSQVVLPPSIHPDTQRPYEANCDLLDVVDKLQVLPRDFEMNLRAALIAEGVKLTTRGTTKVSDWVPAGGRDSALTSNAGILARAVIRKERTLLEAIAEIETWVAMYTEKVVGDAMDPEKGRQKLMEFLRRDVVDGSRTLPQGWDAGMTPDEVREAKLYFGEEIEEWTVDQIIADLTDKFEKVPPEATMQRGELIDATLVRMIKSPSLGAVQHDLIIKFITQIAGRTLGVGSLRKRLLELSRGEVQGNDHTEIAKALIKEVEAYGELRYDGGSFYQWRGAHWADVPESELMGIIASEFGGLLAAKRHGDHRGILQTAVNLVPRGLKEYAVDGINFANGYLTVDGELLNHDPKFGATYVMPYRYMPDGVAPQRFLGLLDQAWGHNPDYMDKVQALREAIACTLFKMAPAFSRAILLVGIAHSGKSTIKKVIEGLVPDDALCCVPPHDWADRFLPTQMQNKLLNFCGELSENAMIAGDKFKSIVEGEELNGQLKGGQIFKFRPLCAQWFASNHLPRTRDSSAGFNRRWLMLQFDKPVSGDAKIIGLDKVIIDEEREAIVAWAIPAMQDLMRAQDFTLPKSHTALISEVATQNNSVRFFMMSGGVQLQRTVADGASWSRTAEAELYRDYYGFCRLKANALPVQLKKFRLQMVELQYELGFKIVLETTTQGEEAYYERIIPVNQRQKAVAA